MSAATGVAEAATMSGRGPTAVSVFQSFAAKLAIIAINTGTGVLTARALHPQGRGELAAILLWPQVLSGALSLGIPSAMIYNLRSTPKRASQLLTAGLLLALLVGVVASIAAILAAPTLMRQYRPEVVTVAQCVMPNVIVATYLLIGRGALEARSLFMHSGLVLTTPPLLTLVGLSVLAVSGRLTPESAAVTYIASGIPALGLVLRHLPLSFSHSVSEIRACMRALLSYGVRSYGIDLCGTLAFYIDQALVVTLLSPGQMGAYVVALSLSRVMNVGQQAVTTVLFPKMVGLGTAEVAALTQRVLRVTSTVSAVSVIAIALFGRTVLQIVYGSAYVNGGMLLLLLVIEAAIAGCVSIVAQAFMASGRPGIITIQQVIGLGCAVPLMLVLIPRMGVTGAAAALLVSTSLRFIFISIAFARLFGNRLPRLLLDAETAEWAWKRLKLSRRPSAAATECAAVAEEAQL